MSYLSGTVWVFNSSVATYDLSGATGGNLSIVNTSALFECNGTYYDEIYVNYSISNNVTSVTIVYRSSLDLNNLIETTVYTSGAWTNNIYKTITFYAEPQSIYTTGYTGTFTKDDFIDWLEANGTQQQTEPSSPGMGFNRIVNKQTTDSFTSDAHVIITQTMVENGSAIGRLRRMSIDNFKEGIGFEAISDIIESLQRAVHSQMVVKYTRLIHGKYIRSVTAGGANAGDEVDNENAACTDFIPAEQGQRFVVHTAGSSTVAVAASYDENKQYISGSVYSGIGDSSMSDYGGTVGYGTKYMRFSFLSENVSHESFYCTIGVEPPEVASVQDTMTYLGIT